MRWKEYYEKYDMWSENTQYSRLASITDFGTKTSPADEIIDCMEYVDERTAKRILKLAIAGGVIFTEKQITQIVEYIVQDSNIIETLIKKSNPFAYTGEDIITLFDCMEDSEQVVQLLYEISHRDNTFSDSELVELIENLTDEDLIRKLLVKNTSVFSEDSLNELCDMGIDDDIIRIISKRSNIPYYDPDEDVDNYESYAIEPEKKPGGFWNVIAAISAIGNSSQTNSRGHNGCCNGNCANCPPHYGYRYGRWYYGHNHSYGCEFGGNHGAERGTTR